MDINTDLGVRRDNRAMWYNCDSLDDTASDNDGSIEDYLMML